MGQLGNKVKMQVYTGQKRESFWNFESENKYTIREIVNRMTRRILAERKNFEFTTAIFYADNKEIARLNGSLHSQK